jgi:hypothetical protein
VTNETQVAQLRAELNKFTPHIHEIGRSVQRIAVLLVFPALFSLSLFTPDLTPAGAKFTAIGILLDLCVVAWLLFSFARDLRKV